MIYGMKKHLYLTYIFISLLLTSCNNDYAGYGYFMDYSNDLPEIVNYKADSIPKDQLKNYHYVFCDTLGNEKRVPWDSCYVIIEEYVNEITGNDTVALVDQKPYDKFLEEYEGEWNPSAREKALKESTFHEYWIITANDNHIYGPLSKHQYSIYREKLDVPNELRLSFEKGALAEFFLDAQKYAVQVIWQVIGFAIWALLVLAIIGIISLIKKIIRKTK